MTTTALYLKTGEGDRKTPNHDEYITIPEFILGTVFYEKSKQATLATITT